MNKIRLIIVINITLFLFFSLFACDAFSISKEIKILGPRTRSEVDLIIRRNLPTVKRCYEKIILANKMSDARIYIDLLVDAGGRVRSSSIMESEYPGLQDKEKKLSRQFESCVVKVMKKLKFSLTKKASLTRVNYPIILKKKKVDIAPTLKSDPLFESYDLKISKGLTEDQVLNELKRNTQEINDCYKAAVSLDRTITGTVRYTWKINSEGRVEEMKKKGKGIKGQKDLMGKKYLENCVIKKINEILFPMFDNSKDVKVSVKFKF